MKNHQSIVVSLFVLLISFNSIKSGIMISFYMVDTKNFVELFCVNKEKPELECNGKCELSKLAESDTSKEKPSYLDILQKEIVLFYSASYSPQPKILAQNSLVDNEYLNNYRFLFTSEFILPPIV
jgi:predicted NAD/FAD-binding protein|tara:strand:- start:265 stop:639 length:375 start_codon:yes stop_codon:yes gene_type:complete